MTDPDRHTFGAPATRRILLVGATALGGGLLGMMPANSEPITPKTNLPRATDGDGNMSFIKTKDGTEIFYKDWGKGQPIVFSHGWPLSADDWDTQMLSFLDKGYRVIAHDRRGHGRSTQTDTGNDMDTYADDVAALVTALDLK